MEQASEFTGKKKEFLRLTVGNHTIRLLPGEEGFYITYTHWINNTNLECAGDECPICMNNKKIINDNPDDFRNVKGYSRKRQVFYVNVLDKTLAKTCASCGEVHKPVAGTFASVCTSCNAVLVDVPPQPVNKICILNRGSELYENIKSINNAILDEAGEKVGVDSFDVMIMVPPKTKRPVAQGLPHQNEVIEIPQEDLYVLEEAPLSLTVDEINKFIRGATLKDIFALRRADEVADETPVSDYEVIDEKAEGVPFDPPYMVKKEEEGTVVVEAKETKVVEEDDLEASVKDLFGL